MLASVIIRALFVALGLFGKAMSKPRGMAPEKTSLDPSHSSTTHLSPTATVTIDSLGVPIHGPGDEEVGPGGSSQLTPLDYCAPASPVSSNATSETQDACPGAVDTESPEKPPPCPKPATSGEIQPPGYGSPRGGSGPRLTTKGATSPLSTAVSTSLSLSPTWTWSNATEEFGPRLTTGGDSSPLSTAVSNSLSSSPSGPWGNVTSESIGRATGTAQGPNPSPLSISSPTGASGSAGPIYTNATGTNGNGWASGTSLASGWNSSQTVDTPSCLTRGATGTASHGPLETSPWQDDSSGSGSQVASSTNSTFPSTPPLSTSGIETKPDQGTVGPSATGTASASWSVPSPEHALQGPTPVFTQQGVIPNLIALFSFPESPHGLYKRLWQPPAQNTPVGGSVLCPSSSSASNETAAGFSPTEGPSRESTCACALPVTAGTPAISSSRISLSTSFETGISATSSPSSNVSISLGTAASSPSVTMSTSVATGISVTPSPSANMTTPIGTGTADISSTPSPSTNITVPIGSTAVSATSSPSPSANVSADFGTTGVSGVSSLSTNISTPFGTAPHFTNATSGALPTATGVRPGASSGAPSPISGVLTAPTSASINSPSNGPETASPGSLLTPPGSLTASLTSSVVASRTSGSIQSSSTAFCSSSSSVGNETIDFDDVAPGQLFNPYHTFWFSEGFMVTPDSESAYQPSSGNQLAEFIPASLSDGRFNNSHDLAMISIGRQGSNPCYRFNLYSMSLGCSSNLPAPPCEFNIWGMRYDESTHQEEGTGTDQDVHTVACDRTRCDLSLTDITEYRNITSVIIKATSGNETQIWWVDDLAVGWTDNSCNAAECRERAGTSAGWPEHGRRLRL